MATIDEIIDAVRHLTFDEYVKLRQALDSFEDQEWKAELERSTKEWKQSGRTDNDIDQSIARRRHESRP